MLLLLALITTYVLAMDLTPLGAATRHDYEILADNCMLVAPSEMCGMLKQKNDKLDGDDICPHLFLKDGACAGAQARGFVPSCYYPQEGCTGAGMQVYMPFNNQCAKHPHMNKVINLMQNFVCDCTDDCGADGCTSAYRNCVHATAGESMDGCQVGTDHNGDKGVAAGGRGGLTDRKPEGPAFCADVQGAGSYHSGACPPPSSDRRRL